MKSKNRKPVYRGIVVFDLDGVLADFEGAFCEAFGYDNRHEYQLGKRYPEHADTVSGWVQEPKNYAELAPIFGGVMWMNQVMSLGFYTAIVTARPTSLKEVTENWLNKYNIRPHKVVHSTIKAAAIKEMVEELDLPTTLFVDDNIHQLSLVRDEMPWIECVAWEQPWNTGWMPRAHYDDKSYKIMVADRRKE